MDVPITFSINNTQIKQLVTIIASILQNAKQESSFIFYIFSTDLNKANKKTIESLQILNAQYTFNFVDLKKSREVENICNNLKVHYKDNSIDVEIFFKFFLPQLLPQHDKVIHLNLDTLVLDDITKLYNYDIDGYHLGAVQDPYFEHFITDGSIKTHTMQNDTYVQYLTNKLHKKDLRYFNASVLLLNLDKFRQENTTTKLCKYVIDHSPLEYADQCAMNAILENEIIYLQSTWNVLRGAESYIAQNKNPERGMRLLDLYKSPSIYNFASHINPWDFCQTNNYRFVREWWEYFKLTPLFTDDDSYIYDNHITNIPFYKKTITPYKAKITLKKETPIPFTQTSNIPIIFSSDEFYAPYLSVAIQSIALQSSPQYNYDIYVLTNNISHNNKHLITTQIKNYNNFSIRFLDISEYFTYQILQCILISP